MMVYYALVVHSLVSNQSYIAYKTIDVSVHQDNERFDRGVQRYIRQSLSRRQL